MARTPSPLGNTVIPSVFGHGDVLPPSLYLIESLFLGAPTREKPPVHAARVQPLHIRPIHQAPQRPMAKDHRHGPAHAIVPRWVVHVLQTIPRAVPGSDGQ